MQLMLTIVLLQFLPSISIATKKFPISEFFKSSSLEVVKDYLCTVNQHEQKCCSCNPTRYIGNWCIDIFWKDKHNFRLTSYLDYFKHKFLNIFRAGDNMTCEPIIYPISANHIIEKRLVRSSYIEEGVSKSCEKEPPFDGRFHIPVVDPAKGVYYLNKKCADLNAVDTKEIDYRLHAECENFTKINTNNSFGTDTLKYLYKCRFSIPQEQLKWDDLKRCPIEIGNCSLNNEYFSLCNAFYAPTRGYRNEYCYKCDVDDDTSSFPIDNCTCFDQGKCSMRRNSMLETTNGFNFRMIKREMIVTKFDYSFPLARFFHVYKHKIAYYRGCFKNCCKCDKYCWKFKDCCADVLWDQEHDVDMETYRQTIVNKTKPYKDHVCEKLLPQEEPTSETSYYYMITTCLKNATQDQREKCLNVDGKLLKTYLPVVGDDEYLYRNSFCAECNFVRQYVHVNIKVKCSFKCKSRLDIEGEKVARRCDGSMPSNSTCPKGHPSQDLCKSIVGPTMQYKNIFCFVCNHEKGQIDDNEFECSKTRAMLSWSMMLRLNYHGEETVSEVDSGNGICHHVDEAYRFLYNNCRSISCRVRKIPFLAQCKQFLTTISRPVFDKCMTGMETISGIYVVVKSETSSDFEPALEALRKTIGINKFEIYFKDESFTVFKANENITENRLIKVELQIVKITSFNSKYNTSLVIPSVHNPVLSTLYNLSFFSNFHAKLCYSFEKVDMKNFTFTSECAVNYKGDEYSFSNISMHFMINDEKIKRSISYCRQYYLVPNCRLEVLEDNINVKDDGTLIHKKITEINAYSVTQYYPLKDSVAVCTQRYPVSKHFDAYISIIGTSLSIFAYPFVIHTYLTIPRLRKGPGKFIVSLCVSLMFADVMFASAWLLHLTTLNQIFQLCFAVGVSMHFGVVLAYMINVIIGFDLLVRFTGFSTWISFKSLNNYSVVFAFLITFIIVGVASFLDHFDILAIGYGKNGICLPWISEGRLYFYILPLGIAFLLSLSMLARVVYIIRKENNRIRTTLKGCRGRRDVNVVSITVKFTVLLGVVEGIGLIQIFQTSRGSLFYSTISILYTLVRSLRGVELLLFFVCKKDVLSFYKEKLLTIKSTNTKRIEQESSL